MRVFVAREIRARIDDPPIHGRADFMVRLKIPESHIRLIELKTINDFGFGKLVGPKYEHMIQLQAYLNMLNIELGSVIYECKNDQKIKSYQVVRDRDLWDGIIKRCQTVQNMSKIPVLKNPEQHDKYCSCLVFLPEEI